MEEYKRNLLFIWIAMFGLFMLTIGVYVYALGELREMDGKLTYMLHDLDFILDEVKKP